MSAELQLRDYLDNSTEASKRIRTILMILVVVTVLILAGFLNSWQGSAWNKQRIEFQAEYVKQLDARIDQLISAKEQLIPGANDFIKLKKSIPSLLDNPSLAPHYGSEKCETWPKDPTSKEQSELVLTDRIRCYQGAKTLAAAFRDETIKAYVDSVYFIRVPFFGVAFDINDLGVIGGVSLIVILIMLRLNLRNFIVSLRIGFKAARKAGLHDEFYDVLAGRQLFAFPDVGDSQQDPYEGRTEAIWNKSKAKRLYERVVKVLSMSFSGLKKALWTTLSILLRSSYKPAVTDIPQLDSPKNNGDGPAAKEADASGETTVNKGWYSNLHPLLALVPTWICLVPAIVYGAVVRNDFLSYPIGMVVHPGRTRSSFGFSLACLVVIFGLGCWCVSKWIEIDRLWKIFSEPTSRRSSSTRSSEVHVGDGDNSHPKSVAPVVSTT